MNKELEYQKHIDELQRANWNANAKINELVEENTKLSSDLKKAREKIVELESKLLDEIVENISKDIKSIKAKYELNGYEPKHKKSQ